MLHLLVKIISKHGGSGIDKIHESSSIIAMASILVIFQDACCSFN